jgi:hypothetical protein
MSARRAARLALLTGTAMLCASGGALASGSHTTAQASTPEAHVRGFYAWYLGALRAGRTPSADAAAMKSWLTDAEIAELRVHRLARFDPVLGLPEPHSNWAGMKVEVGKASYYQKPGLYDAYVEVRYSGFKDPEARTRGDTRFVGTIDDWMLGLKRTPAGWRIASISVSE